MFVDLVVLSQTLFKPAYVLFDSLWLDLVRVKILTLLGRLGRIDVVLTEVEHPVVDFSYQLGQRALAAQIRVLDTVNSALSPLRGEHAAHAANRGVSVQQHSVSLLLRQAARVGRHQWRQLRYLVVVVAVQRFSIMIHLEAPFSHILNDVAVPHRLHDRRLVAQMVSFLSLWQIAALVAH